jgi:hypothetical protein
VGIGNADEIVMPLTPRHVAVLGQGSESREATDDEVDHYNTLQVRIAYRHVYFRPGSGLAGSRTGDTRYEGGLSSGTRAL